MYFCPGKVDIKTDLLALTAAFTKDQTATMTNYVKDIESNAVKTGIAKMGNLFGSAVSMGARAILENAQWYKWTAVTTKYMKYVNEMLIELAVWMGLIDTTSNGLLEGWQEELSDVLGLGENASDEQLENFVKDNTNKKWYEKLGSKHKAKTDPNTGITVVTGYLGGSRTSDNSGLLSVLKILPQFTKSNWIKTGSISMLNDNDENIPNGDSLKEGKLQPEELFIPFGMCKGVSVSESFSNSMGEHPLLNEYNTQYETSNERLITQGFNMTTASNISEQVSGIMSGVQFKDDNGDVGVGSVLSGAAQMGFNYLSKNIGKMSNSELGMVAAGAGRFILPEIWTNSTFDRNYNITFKFRSPYGHRLSIFENTMVPLLFLIALTAPRAVGLSSYTNPFYVKAFSKGLFSCDLGMITSLSISRGEDKNDRTYDGFFRTVTASVSIKDMLPTMQLGLDAGHWGLTHSANSGMTAYMCNLAGVDFIERANLYRDAEQIFQKLRTNFEEFGPNVRTWMSSKIAGASVLGLSAKSFSGTNNPMNDRKYLSSY